MFSIALCLKCLCLMTVERICVCVCLYSSERTRATCKSVKNALDASLNNSFDSFRHSLLYTNETLIAIIIATSEQQPV